MTSVETVEKSKNDAANRVGVGWYGKWVGLHLLAGIVAAQIQMRTLDLMMLGDNLAPSWIGSLWIAGTFVLIGAQTYALPYPVRRDWLRWLAFVLVAEIIIVGANNGFARGMSVRLFAVTTMVVNLVLSVTVGGGAEWLVLRRHVRGAGWWFSVVGVASLVALTASTIAGLALNLFVGSAEMTMDTAAGIRLFISIFTSSLVTGAGLWWLVARDEGKPKRKVDTTV